MSNITRMLDAAAAGGRQAAGALLPLVYGELRALAGARMANESFGHTLDATALVHEAYLRLVGPTTEARFANRRHFFAAAAESMRRILVDHARRRASIKRGGGVDVTDIDNALDIGERMAEEALDLDAALTQLNERDPDLARVVEWHFFAGLTFKEIGDELGRHERTVYHDWELARSVLQESMRDLRR